MKLKIENHRQFALATGLLASSWVLAGCAGDESADETATSTAGASAGVAGTQGDEAAGTGQTAGAAAGTGQAAGAGATAGAVQTAGAGDVAGMGQTAGAAGTGQTAGVDNLAGVGQTAGAAGLGQAAGAGDVAGTSQTAGAGDMAGADSGSQAGDSGAGVAGSNVVDNVQASELVVTVVEADIATVGDLTFTIDKTIDAAYVEFGRDGNVEYRVDVDLAEPDYRTLLLGMKQGQTYTVRVVASNGDENYVSDDVTFEAGYISNSLPEVTMTEEMPGASYGGFTVSCNGVGGAAPGQDTAASWAFIFDGDGDYVWGYNLAGTPAQGCSRARMSHDGKHLWAGTFSNTTSENTTGALLRVSMDGSEATTYTTAPTSGENIQVENINFRHHDFTILPSGNVLYPQRKDGDDSSPDEIRELDIATGSSALLFDEANLAGISDYHTNYVTYIPARQAFSFSMRHSNTIVLAQYPSGDLMGIINGEEDEFGINPKWTAQHGHQFLESALLVFNNNNSGPADILDIPVDVPNKTSGQIGSYRGGPTSIAFGDVQRLPNGNTFVTYSNAGELHEVDPSWQLIKKFVTDSLGYAEHRIDLYGPPPHLE